MSIKIGDIDVANEIIDLHFQVRRTQLLLERTLGRTGVVVTPEDITAAEQEAFSWLQAKFPSMGIVRKG